MRCGSIFRIVVGPSQCIKWSQTQLISIVPLGQSGPNKTFAVNNDVGICIHLYYYVVIFFFFFFTNPLLQSVNSVPYVVLFEFIGVCRILSIRIALSLSLSFVSLFCLSLSRLPLLSFALLCSCFPVVLFGFLHHRFLFVLFGFIQHPHPFPSVLVVITHCPFLFLLFTLSDILLSLCSLSQTIAWGTFE